MINIIINEEYKSLIQNDIIEQSVIIVMKLNNFSKEYDLSIVIENDETLRDLNTQYRDIDAVTDVLSFQANELDPETNRLYLGDIVVSYPQAVSQSSIANHPVQNEISLLVIHGLLHLLDFDHSNEKERAIMWKIQEDALTQMGLKMDLEK